MGPDLPEVSDLISSNEYGMKYEKNGVEQEHCASGVVDDERATSDVICIEVIIGEKEHTCVVFCTASKGMTAHRPHREGQNINAWPARLFMVVTYEHGNPPSVNKERVLVTRNDKTKACFGFCCRTQRE